MTTARPERGKSGPRTAPSAELAQAVQQPWGRALGATCRRRSRPPGRARARRAAPRPKRSRLQGEAKQRAAPRQRGREEVAAPGRGLNRRRYRLQGLSGLAGARRGARQPGAWTQSRACKVPVRIARARLTVPARRKPLVARLNVHTVDGHDCAGAGWGARKGVHAAARCGRGAAATTAASINPAKLAEGARRRQLHALRSLEPVLL